MNSRPFPARRRRFRWSRITLLGLPLLVLLVVGALAMAAVQIQAAVRAYELSTSQTASAHAQAINALVRYARSHTEADWARYREAMRLPDSARQTRDLLRQYGPEGLPQIQKLMIDAGRHPADVTAMLRLYRWFGTRFMSPTTRDAWRKTDALMLQLDQEAERLRVIARHDANPDDINAILQRIDVLEGGCATWRTFWPFPGPRPRARPPPCC